MELEITNEKQIRELKSTFNDRFPYLKLEFFSKLHEPGKATGLKFKIPEDKFLQDAGPVKENGKILVSPEMTINELEQLFGKKFGLGVQVFRRTGNSWFETILTDYMTLDAQNKEGEELTRIHEDRMHGRDPSRL